MAVKRGLLGWIFFVAVLHAAAQDTLVPADYARFFPDSACHPRAFALAARGYNYLRAEGVLRQPRYLTIVDFTRRSSQPRLFLLDVRERRTTLRSTVSHGLGSDPDSTTLPCWFSNRDGSHASSAGFYLTGAVYANYRPVDSLGLCLFGLDAGFNDSAAAREIVVHYGATERRGTVYVTDTGAGRSYGCPALPLSANSRYIGLAAGGSVLFLYSDRVADYEARSTVLSRRVRWPVRQRGPGPNFCSCTIAPGQVSYGAAGRPRR